MKDEANKKEEVLMKPVLPGNADKKPAKEDIELEHAEIDKKNLKDFFIISAALIGVGLIFWISGGVGEVDNGSNSIIQNQKVSFERAELRGSEVYAVNEEKRTLLFTDVDNVSEVIKGPDGKSIHFKRVSMSYNRDSNADYRACADISRRTTYSPPHHESDMRAGPWEYSRISHGNSVAGCGMNGLAGGYLRDSSKFAYIVESDDQAQLMIEDLETNRVSKFIIDQDSWKDLKDKTNIVDTTYSFQRILHPYPGVKGFDGKTYYYPNKYKKMIDGKLALAFYTLIVVVDENNESVIGIDQRIGDSYNAIAWLYSLLGNEESPFLVIESGGYDGGRRYFTLLDASGSELRATDLSDMPQRSLAGWDSDGFIEWGPDSISINTFKEVDITNLLSESDTEFLEENNISFREEDHTPAQTEKLKELSSELNSADEYKEVKCYGFPSFFTDALCVGLSPSGTYTMEAGGELLKE